jgi:hypothetical protein
MRKLAATIVLAAALTAYAALPEAERFPTHVDIPESNAKWQVLPEAIHGACVQDGKRVWYELEHPAQKENLEVVEKIIRDQFDKPNPQLYGASIQFFETGGRVWFRSHSGETLLSYDGKVFQRYPPVGVNHHYVGSCPNTGISQSLDYRHGANGQVGPTVFLAESHGVLCVTGDKPSYHPLTEADPLKRGLLNYPVISLEPDGQGVLAHVVVDGQVILHRWRGGQWSEIPVPAKVATRVEVAPWADGAWIFPMDDLAFFVEYPKAGGTLLEQLVAELGDKEFAVRDRATKRLIEIGSPYRKQIEAARQAATDPEVRVRLDKVLVATRVEDKMTHLGGLGLKRPSLGLCEGGWMYVKADAIIENGEDRGPGVVLAKPGGEYRLFLGKPVCDAFAWTTKPLVLKEHSLIWTGSWQGQGAQLFDVEKGAFVLNAPDPAFRWPHAVMSDGTVILGKSEKPHAYPLAVFRPEGK